MDFDELKAGVRSRILDIIHSNKWREPDDFSIILAEKAATRLASHKSLAWNDILSRTKTTFFIANGISKKKFLDELEPAMTDLAESYRPFKRQKTRKATPSKNMPRIDFTEDVKLKVLREQDHRCARCGRLLVIMDWDHKDGNRSNSDISNARALCPNCHDTITRKRQMGIEEE